MGIDMFNILIVMVIQICRALQMVPVKCEVYCMAIIQSKKLLNSFKYLKMSGLRDANVIIEKESTIRL